MGLKFQNIHHAYGRNKVVHDVSFSAEQGEITCLLGPSGCGKTTLLQIAAGILDIQHGQLFLKGKILAESGNNPPPEKRSVGLVFQDGALFPHLNVEKNIGFGIRDASKRSARVKDLLEKIGMGGFEKRFPNTLSGGQQQRIAFARAIAPSPSLLLLDEPFANVDIQLRKNLRALVRSILKTEGCAAILVTHDPSEALEIADKIVVLNAGRVIQSGSPQTLYDHPATTDIEALLGGGQPLSGTLSQTHIKTVFGEWPRSVIAPQEESATPLPLPLPLPLGEINICIRANDIDIKTSNTSSISIQDITCIGAHLRATLQTPESTDILFANLPRSSKLNTGDTVEILPRKSSIFIFPK